MVIYPQSVVDFANKVIEIIDKNDFYSNTEFKDIERAKDISHGLLCEHMLPKFINGDDLIFNNEEEADMILRRILVSYTIDSLVKKGLVNYIDNECGEEMVFLTKKGKEYAKNIVSVETQNVK